MKTETLKLKWHKLVDEMADDDRYWKDLYKSVKEVNKELKTKPKIDIIDELTEEQYARLKHAMKQLDEGKGIPHEEVMKKLRKKWLKK